MATAAYCSNRRTAQSPKHAVWPWWGVNHGRGQGFKSSSTGVALIQSLSKELLSKHSLRAHASNDHGREPARCRGAVQGCEAGGGVLARVGLEGAGVRVSRGAALVRDHGVRGGGCVPA